MSTFLQFMFTKYFWRHVGLMAFVSLLLLGFVFLLLSTYTHHGESITVPDLRKLTLEQVEKRLEALNLRYTVLDSAYQQDLPPLGVIDQTPKPGDKVKESRRIYLTVNATNPPLVPIPNIIDASLRSAEVQLNTAGLRVGQQIRVPDLAKNAVLDIKINNKSVAPGTKIPKGSAIDLVLGDGLGNTRITVPSLIGLTFLQAKLALRGYGLNVGLVTKEENIKDMENALVTRQSPDPGPEGDRLITQGEPVDLFLRENPESPVLQMPDTFGDIHLTPTSPGNTGTSGKPGGN
ncbi:PASTA domain-containing protein [Sphingobacteriales bacterium UPWRP_1]|nr:hypothetical protein B6N25_03165 [Sphingobacteriales bacterium TSM_CSS]PSJ73647.1 PASTA domain-containing protein [Sphingobacteriales bacterium UPWRP_1]